MKLGARDFIQKPLDMDYLLLLLRRCADERAMRSENLLLKDEFQKRFRLPAIIGDYFGANHATSNYGFLYTAKGVASIGGGWIAAKMFERFGNWNADFYVTAALALLSGILILAVKFMPLPARNEGAEPVMVVAKVS